MCSEASILPLVDMVKTKSSLGCQHHEAIMIMCLM